MKFRSLFAFLLCAITAYGATSPPNVPLVKGVSVVVIDANNGTILFSKNPNECRPVGSTQKLLTSLIVAEQGDLNHLVTIIPFDEVTEPTMLSLKPGDSYSRLQLLTALLVKSPNDVARALARDEAGSLDAFAVMMNKRAAELGMTSSHFVNPNGLPAEGQYSTAADMAKLAFAVYHNSLLRSIVSTKYYPFHEANGNIHLLKNSNNTMHNNSFCNGMKTGYTAKSKHCLVSSGCYQGHDAITIILGSSDRSQLFKDSATLLRWALGLPVEPVTIMRHLTAPPQKTSSTPSSKRHHKKKKKVTSGS